MSACPEYPPLARSLSITYAGFYLADKNTFQIPPIKALLQKYISPDSVVVDPFCGDSTVAVFRNDLKRKHGKRANDYLDLLIWDKVVADVVLLDPPYSPRQIKECYESVGLEVSQTDTQNARLYSEARERLDKLLKHQGIAISCGWNTTGFGKKYGYEPLEILIVNHGGAHNDTLVKVEYKP
jgi:hypothetical protein